MCTKQHIYGTPKSNQLLQQSRHGCTADEENDGCLDGMQGILWQHYVKSSLCAPAPLLPLSSMARFYVYLFIHSKGNQTSFPMQAKKHKQQKQDPKSTNKKSKTFLSSPGPLPHQTTSTVTGVQSTPDSATLPPKSIHQWHDRDSRGLAS